MLVMFQVIAEAGMAVHLVAAAADMAVAVAVDGREDSAVVVTVAEAEADMAEAVVVVKLSFTRSSHLAAVDMEEVDTEAVLVAVVDGKEAADSGAADSVAADTEAVVDGKEVAGLEEADTAAVLAAAVAGKEVAVVRLYIPYISWLIIAMCFCVISVVDRAVRVFCIMTRSCLVNWYRHAEEFLRPL